MSSTVKKQPMIRWYGKLFYGAGNMGYGLISQTYSTFLMIFGTEVLGIAGTLVGLVASIGTLFDACTDPLMGTISDKTNSKLLGRRHGYMLVATFLMAICNIFLWSAPVEMNKGALFAWLLIGVLLVETANTLFGTPYNALGMELAGDYNERTKVQSYKSVFFVLSMIVPTLLMSFFRSEGDNSPTPFLNMAYLTSTLGILFGLICFFGTYSHLPRLRAKAMLTPIEKKESFKVRAGKFFAIFKDRNYRAIVLGSAFSMMVAPILTGAGFLMFTYTFPLGGKMMLLMGMLFVMTVISQPFWAVMCKKIDRKPSLMIGLFMVLGGFAAMFVLFLSRETLNQNPTTLFWLLTPVMVVAGFGTGSMFSIPYAMMADTIAYNSQNSTEEKTATYTSFMTLAYKVSQGLALLLVGILLDAVGYAKPPEGVSQIPIGAQWGLGWIVVIGGLISIGFGIFFFASYSLKAKDVPDSSLVQTPEYLITGMSKSYEQTKLLNDPSYLRFLNSLPSADYKREIESLIKHSVSVAQLVSEKQEQGLLKEVIVTEDKTTQDRTTRGNTK